MQTHPLVVSNEVWKKELQHAYTNVESMWIQTVMKLNKCYDMMTGLWKDYFKLSKESDHLMCEMNARDSFSIITQSGLNLNREMKMKTSKLQNKLCEISVKSEKSKISESDDGVAKETKMEVTSQDVHDLNFLMDFSDTDESDTIIPAKFFKRHKCEFYSKQYVNKRSFKCHIDSHAGKNYSCDECSKKKFKNKISFQRHMNFHKRGNKYLYCNEYKEKFEEIYQLTSHRKKT